MRSVKFSTRSMNLALGSIYDLSIESLFQTHFSLSRVLQMDFRNVSSLLWKQDPGQNNNSQQYKVHNGKKMLRIEWIIKTKQNALITLSSGETQFSFIFYHPTEKIGENMRPPEEVFVYKGSATHDLGHVKATLSATNHQSL